MKVFKILSICILAFSSVIFYSRTNINYIITATNKNITSPKSKLTNKFVERESHQIALINEKRKNSAFMPPPTELSSQEQGENEIDEQKAREKWYNNMHRTAPGINWKSIDDETRFQKYLSKHGILQKTEILDSGKLKGTWAEKGSNNQAGRIMLCDIDTVGNHIYAASGGGNIFKGDSNGTGWKCLNENLKFNGICMLRILQMNNHNRILVATGSNNFYFSDDDGSTWNKSKGLANAILWGYCSKGIMTNDSSHSIFLLMQEWDYKNWGPLVTIYHSKDKGQNFSKLVSYADPDYYGPNHYDIWTAYYGSGKTYLLHEDSVYSIKAGDTVLNYQGKISLKNTGNEFLTGTESGGQTYLYSMIDTFIYASQDAGKSWKYKGYNHETPYTKWSFHCSDTKVNSIQIGSVDCWKSTDGGASWAVVNNWWDYYPSPSNKLHADIQGILSFHDKQGEFMMIGNDGGLYRASSDFSTVTNLGMSGLNASQYYTVLTNKNNLNICYAGSQDQGFQRSLSDSGKALKFDQLISGDYGHISSADGGNTLWTVYPTFADYYPNAAKSKSQFGWPYTFKNPALWMAPIMADPEKPDQAWLGGGSNSSSGAHLVLLNYISSDSTVNASEDTFDFSRNNMGNISAIACSPINSDNRYVLTENGAFYYSSDAGYNWTLNSSFTAPKGHYFYGSYILPSSLTFGKLWICGSGYSNPAVYVSEDNGKTFKAIKNGMPNTLVFQLAADSAEKFIYAATENGPYVLNTDEDTWYDLAGTSAPDQTYWTVDYIPSTNTARFGTYGRGIWDFKVDNGSVSGIKSIEKTNSSLNIYPNPTNGVLFYKFENPDGKETIADIITLDGQVLFHERIYSGEGGINVSTISKGVYIFRLIKQDGSVENTKITIQ